MSRATWTFEEIEKVINKVYSTKIKREKQLSCIVAHAQGTVSGSGSISLTNIVMGMHNARTSTDKFISVLLELDAL